MCFILVLIAESHTDYHSGGLWPHRHFGANWPCTAWLQLHRNRAATLERHAGKPTPSHRSVAHTTGGSGEELSFVPLLTSLLSACLQHGKRSHQATLLYSQELEAVGSACTKEATIMYNHNKEKKKELHIILLPLWSGICLYLAVTGWFLSRSKGRGCYGYSCTHFTLMPSPAWTYCFDSSRLTAVALASAKSSGQVTNVKIC